LGKRWDSPPEVKSRKWRVFQKYLQFGIVIFLQHNPKGHGPNSFQVNALSCKETGEENRLGEKASSTMTFYHPDSTAIHTGITLEILQVHSTAPR